jgi:2-aminoadipate transaminase
VRATGGEVLITTGSQQGIDLVGKILLDPGDVVAVEDPSYLAALQVFHGYEVDFEAIASDSDGMRMDALEAVLLRRKVKLIYVVADFHNPKGTTLSLARRHKLLELAARHGAVILEDDPYGELRFSGVRPPPIAALDPSGSVLQLGTFSKTLAPGLRIGWLTGPRALIRAAITAKQAADLHSSTLSQRAVSALLETFDYDAHLDSIRALYAARGQAMIDALGQHMPAGTTWTRPEGGLFLWVKLPQKLSADALFPAAIAEKVAFVPGAPFFAVDAQHDFMRLNFSNRPIDLIQTGMARLGKVVHAALAQTGSQLRPAL